MNIVGLNSSVGVATSYGLGGLVIEFRWGEEGIFCTNSERSWGQPSLVYNGYRVIPEAKVAGAWC
jgi:hypothetical protein